MEIGIAEEKKGAVAYKTFSEQKAEHVKLVRNQGLDISDLILNTPKWVRCKAVGSEKGRGELSYISTTQLLANGLTGLSTSWRGINGSGSHKTYGYGPGDTEMSLVKTSSIVKSDDEGLRKRAYGFWINSSTEGDSPYLKAKGVSHYGIRFRETTIVTPLRDVRGILRSYQLINQDGTKLFMKDSGTLGLFHWIRQPEPGESFGLAEGYTTAATVFELTGMPIAACMSAQNLVDVTKELISFFPAIPIFLFADNDRHLERNIGLMKAVEAQALAPERIRTAVPDFGDISPGKDATDWNDLVRILGRQEAMRQLQNRILLA